ncbi:hypothetical protein [Streptomyces sp. NPDC004783]|uniref:hypothetical protein n=1 Tax=Streptomyces sp. NPDC004783 TaxID=3154459 RepID=UPI0033BDB4D7
MTWSLSYLPPRESELLDALFLSAGRSLHLANTFEMKCRWILRCINLLRTYEKADPVATLEDLIAALPADEMLGRTLGYLTKHMSCSTENLYVLQQAREARNFIAHEGASVGFIHSVHEKQIFEHVSRLRSAVSHLAAGDNVISQWGYHLEEPHEHLPRDLIEAYVGMIDDWVFGHFGDLLDETVVPPER